MVDPVTLRRLSFRTLFAGIAAIVVFLRILPFGSGGGGMPAPELLTLMTFAWVLRRPEYVPVLLIAGVHLAADILFLRPLGLWTALVLLGTEFLRRRAQVSTELPFPVEWLLVSVTLAALSVMQVAILGLLAVPQPGPGSALLQVMVSAMFYPLVVVVTAFGLGVRPPAPAERDAERQRA